MQRCVVSFGAMFLILFYNTRMSFLRCCQGRYGEKYTLGICKFCLPQLNNAKTNFQPYSVPTVRRRHLKLPIISVLPSIECIFNHRLIKVFLFYIALSLCVIHKYLIPRLFQRFNEARSGYEVMGYIT